MTERKTVSRAEAVRQRRKQEELRRDAQPLPLRRAAKPTPTLTRRGVSLDAATTRIPPERRLDRRYEALAATAPTRHLQAPTMPRFQFGKRWWSLLLMAVLGLAIYLVWTAPFFQVGAAQVVGNQFVSADEVNSVMGVSNHPVFLVVPSDVEQSLRSNFPEFKSVKVSVQLPNLVSVDVTERQPIIRWEQGSAYTWVDAEGVAFRPRGDAQGLIVVQASSTPVAGLKSGDDALAPTPFVAQPIVDSIRALAPYVPAGSTMLYDAKNGLGWVDGRGWTVWFGTHPNDVEAKLRVYQALVESLGERGISPALISVAYPNAPYYRLGQ